MNLSKNIFYDSCKGEFNRRIVGGRTDNAKTCDNNCYWYKGGSGLEKKLMVIMVIKVLQLMA